MKEVKIRLFRIHLQESTYCTYSEYKIAWKKAKALSDHFPKFECADFISEEWDDYKSGNLFVTGNDIWVTDDEFLEIIEFNPEIKVAGSVTKVIGAANIFKEASEKATPIAVTEEHNEYNSHCQVHMPGNLMSTYNELLLKEDCCTDELQGALASGWRLISVCPQPDQRRPDYILGRYNPNIDLQDSAER